MEATTAPPPPRSPMSPTSATSQEFEYRGPKWRGGAAAVAAAEARQQRRREKSFWENLCGTGRDRVPGESRADGDSSDDDDGDQVSLTVTERDEGGKTRFADAYVDVCASTTGWKDKSLRMMKISCRERAPNITRLVRDAGLLALSHSLLIWFSTLSITTLLASHILCSPLSALALRVLTSSSRVRSSVRSPFISRPSVFSTTFLIVSC